MGDAFVRFDREDAEGVVAVGSYIGDAAKRFGVKFEEECIPSEERHYCAVGIREGADLLSEKTAAEKQFLKEAKLGKNWRLACHAKVEEPGEFVVMTKEKEEKEKEKAEEEKEQAEEYRKRFEDLPLEKKMAELVRLEGIALSETLSFIVNSPYKAADKLMDIMAEFGFKLETQKKESAKPEEHRTNGASADETTSETTESKEDSKEDKEPEQV
ncbi:MAG TPA: hypothetical protein VFZ49_05595 [Pyrinomonadaceae bacterium]